MTPTDDLLEATVPSADEPVPARPPKVSKRVLARLDRSGIEGSDGNVAAQRLVAFFGDFAPRELSDRERGRYLAMCVACKISVEEAEADLALLRPAAPLGRVFPAPAGMPTQTALRAAPAPGSAPRFSQIDALAEVLASDDVKWVPRFVPDDQVDLIADVGEDGDRDDPDGRTQEWLRSGGRLVLRVAAARKLAAAGKAAARTGRRRRREQAASEPDMVRSPDDWKARLAEAGLKVGADELRAYKRSVRASRGDDVSAAAVILNLLGPEPPATALRKYQWAYRSARARAVRLLCFFGTYEADGVTTEAANRYRDMVASISYARNTDDPKYYSYTTIQNDLIWLRRAFAEFARDSQLTWTPTFQVPHERVVRAVFLTRKQVARLLWACRGRRHDPDAPGGWKLEEVPVKGRRKWVWDGEPGTDRDGHWKPLQEAYPGETMTIIAIDSDAKENRVGLAKAIIIAVYSGTRHEAVMRLVWGVHATRGRIDVERGMIFRYGTETPATKKTAFPVSRLAPPLHAQARIWFANRKPPPKVSGSLLRFRMKGGRKPPPAVDAVIRQASDEHYASSHLTTAFAKMVEAAGLDPYVVMHSLRHTAATWHAIMGTDCRQAAKLLGMSLEVMDRIYAHWTVEDGEGGVAIWRNAEARSRLKAVDFVGSGRDDRPRIDHAPPQQRPRRPPSEHLARRRAKRELARTEAR